ncbi:MAG: MoaD/ThiS family protein [Gammaproteobacteria bacterium]|nr:MoaD/ThiS family protein [Gammaproteobacteria bacterium]
MAKILYFGPLADMLHKESEQLPLPVEVRTVSELLGHLRNRGNEWSLYLTEDKLQTTINRQFVSLQTAIKDTDEIALIPIARRI